MDVIIIFLLFKIIKMNDELIAYKYNKYKTKYNDLLRKQQKQQGGDDVNNTNDQTKENIVQILFSHKIMIKMLHFQTKKYSYHKILDVYLTGFDLNFDKYMEVIQGIESSRLQNSTMNINVEMATDINIIEKLNEFIDFLKKLNIQNEGLNDVRNGMVKEAENLKYLLTFA